MLLLRKFFFQFIVFYIRKSERDPVHQRVQYRPRVRWTAVSTMKLASNKFLELTLGPKNTHFLGILIETCKFKTVS